MEDIVGKRFESNTGGWFTVLRKSEKKLGTKYLYEILFDEANGIMFKTLVTKQNIILGKVKNLYFPTNYGIGYLGEADVKNNKLIYTRWTALLSRCYDTKADNYKYYGQRGVHVCERWLCFQYFLEDFKQLDGYDEDNLQKLQLDKDIKISGNKIYSPNACMLVTRTKNNQNREFRRNKYFVAISPEGETFKSNNQRQFARDHNLTRIGIGHVLKGKHKTTKGWKFEYIEQ